MGKKCKSKESIKARSRRRRTLKKNRHNIECQRNATNEIQTTDAHACSLSAEDVDERDHSNMNKDPFFKDFKRYVAAKIRLDKAKQQMNDCCGPSVVKTMDGHVKVVFLDEEYKF